ncbi:hypothetical protein ACWYRQ_19135 [Clostridioides difficile]
MAGFVFHSISTAMIQLEDKKGLSNLAFSERLSIGNHKTNKNIILILSIGLMLFLGFQSLFQSVRFTVENIVTDSIHYDGFYVFDDFIAEDNIENSSMNYSMDYGFEIKESQSV